MLKQMKQPSRLLEFQERMPLLFIYLLLCFETRLYLDVPRANTLVTVSMNPQYRRCIANAHIGIGPSSATDPGSSVLLSILNSYKDCSACTTDER